jgi:hypothetical protein
MQPQGPTKLSVALTVRKGVSPNGSEEDWISVRRKKKGPLALERPVKWQKAYLMVDSYGWVFCFPQGFPLPLLVRNLIPYA